MNKQCINAEETKKRYNQETCEDEFVEMVSLGMENDDKHLTCPYCVHRNDDFVFTCRAFPKGIPTGFQTGTQLHKKVINGQTGNFVFERESTKRKAKRKVTFKYDLDDRFLENYSYDKKGSEND